VTTPTGEPDVDQFTWLPDDVVWDDDQDAPDERKAKVSAWDEAKHPRDPDGKFGDHGGGGVPGPIFDFGGSADISLDEPPSGPVFSPTPKAKPVKKGKAKPMKKTTSGPIFSPAGGGSDDEIDLEEPSGPIFSFGDEEPDLGDAPSGPIFSPASPTPEPPGHSKPPAEPDDSPRRTYGRGFVDGINKQSGGKEYTDLPADWEMDRVDKIEGNYNWFENLTPQQQQTVRDTISTTSQKPTYVRMMPYGLGQTTRDGRMKNVHETRSKDDRYLDQRSDYEREVMGIDPGTPDEYKPIYGYVGDIGTADAYGPVAVKLKPQVRQRTTATVGDSLNGLAQPYGVDKLPDLSHDQMMANIYGGVNVQNHLPHGSIFDYMEAQIHGGVSLDDIDSVHVDLEPGETLDDMFEPSTLATLHDRGIPVIANQPDLLPRLTPEQIAKLKGDH
jgi:hypothetical protein